MLHSFLADSSSDSVICVHVSSILFRNLFCILEKAMATCSRILAWRVSWTEEAGGLQSTAKRHD